MSVVCAVVLGPQNTPLFFRTFPPEAPFLHLQYILHACIDVLEERVLQQQRLRSDASDPFLGLLSTTEEYRMYGYLTNTGTKLLLALDNAAVRDDQVSKALKRLHAAYVDVCSNPFFDFHAPLASPKFEAQVELLAAAFPRQGWGSSGSLAPGL